MPFALFYLFLAWVLRETSGHYDSQFILILSAGFVLVVLSSFVPKLTLADSTKTILWKLLFATATLYFCFSLWTSPGIVYVTSSTLLSTLTQLLALLDRKSTRLNSSHIQKSRMPSSA